MFSVLRPKTIGKRLLSSLLEAQVKRLRKTRNFQVVVVAGSVGKTSTKLAIAQTLTLTGMRVRYQEGNYNDRLTVPLVLFNQPLPGLFNLLAWIKILFANEKIIRNAYPYDVAVLELGTDAPGQIAKFAYLKPELAVLTAVAAEHMEYFGTLDAVAKEELQVAATAKKILINTDDVAQEYLTNQVFTSYGLQTKESGYYAEATAETMAGQTLHCFKDNQKFIEQTIVYLGPQGRKIVLAAVAVADMLDIESEQTRKAIAQLEPFAGRMQLLKGVKDSTLIDDTYNATPAAVLAALTVLQRAEAPQRIAILGSMNELGDHSAAAHEAIGKAIDPNTIALVVTIGTEARDYLAPAAQAQGCRVQSFLNPYEAGEYVKTHMAEGCVILCKGSQNGVFSEEAIKPLLQNNADATKLVRQSESWMKKKRQQFNLPD